MGELKFNCFLNSDNFQIIGDFGNMIENLIEIKTKRPSESRNLQKNVFGYFSKIKKKCPKFYKEEK